MEDVCEREGQRGETGVTGRDVAADRDTRAVADGCRLDWGDGRGGRVARRTVVGLGGDEDGGDEQAVDVVVRRAEGGTVLLAEPG